MMDERLNRGTKVLEQLAKKHHHLPTLQEFTCVSCDHERDCEFAWDLYNTGGDCLASK